MAAVCYSPRHHGSSGESRLQTISAPRTSPPPLEPLPSPTDVGMLGVHQLKRAWGRQRAKQKGQFAFDPGEFHRDRLVFDALGLGLEQTLQFLGQNAPTFDE